ncbi:tetratricopeptide repeat protein, partial [Candidatus Peregrinibacteria bacterium]|nr:tetratricopeptide repeat protein [Candidatus Peregrinibacteria bacterium]
VILDPFKKRMGLIPLTEYDTLPYMKLEDCLDYARKYYKLKMYKKALERLYTANRLDPDCYEVKLLLGKTFNMQGNYEKAYAMFSKAIEINSNPNVLIRRGIIALTELKDYEKAIKDFSSTIKISEKNIEPYYFRGCAYFKLKQYQEAIYDFEKTVEIDSNFLLGYLNKAFTLAKLGKKEQAIKEYKKTLRLSKKAKYKKKYNIIVPGYKEYVRETIKEVKKLLSEEGVKEDK